MNKLASYTIRTVLILMKLLTKFSLVTRRNMLFLLELMVTMCKCASIAVRAVLCFDPTLAQLRLYFQLVVSGHDATITFESEWIFAHPKWIILRRINFTTVMIMMIMKLMMWWAKFWCKALNERLEIWRIALIALVHLLHQPDPFSVWVLPQEIVLIIYLILQVTYLPINGPFLRQAI